jgi:[NiFe] hydrogenase assembly HybE family chaperone
MPPTGASCASRCVNPALEVEAVGFRPWADHWLGVLITPWFMNLVLMPRVAAQWTPIGERETRHHVFPAGAFEFIGRCDATLGDYQACSLFSPMFEFADQAEARATAIAALDALFDRACRDAGELHATASTPTLRVNKRDFLFGSAPRADHGPRG